MYGRRWSGVRTAIRWIPQSCVPGGSWRLSRRDARAERRRCPSLTIEEKAHVYTSAAQEDWSANLSGGERCRRGFRRRSGSGERFRRHQDRQDWISCASDRRGRGLGVARPVRLRDLGREDERSRRGSDRGRHLHLRVRLLRQRVCAGEGARRRHQAHFRGRRQVHHDAGRRYLAGGAAHRQQVGDAGVHPAAERSLAGYDDVDRALRGASHLQRHRRLVDGRTDARSEDRRDLRTGRRAGAAIGGDLSRRFRGARYRCPGHRFLRSLHHRLRAGDDVDALDEPGHPVPRHRLRGLRASAVRAGVPAGFQGQDHFLHGRLLRKDRGEDLRRSSWKASSSSSRTSTIRR